MILTINEKSILLSLFELVNASAILLVQEDFLLAGTPSNLGVANNTVVRTRNSVGLDHNPAEVMCSDVRVPSFRPFVSAVVE
jgi:hypothetical protein